MLKKLCFGIFATPSVAPMQSVRIRSFKDEKIPFGDWDRFASQLSLGMESEVPTSERFHFVCS